jgi:hypothetical protein
MLAIGVGLFALGALGSVNSAAAPFSPSEYSASALCEEPALGMASCLGLRLVAKAPLAVAGARLIANTAPAAESQAAPTIIEYNKPFRRSLGPSELRGAYNLTGAPPPASVQTIAIVDAYDDPTAEADLERYDQQFGLPPCTRENQCFRKVNQQGGESPLPRSNSNGEEPEAGWALEVATDIELAHGACPACRIRLVEASSAAFSDLEAAEETAVAALHATEISNSWGGPECAVKEAKRTCVSDSPAFDHPGVVITVAAGDNGYRDWYQSRARLRGYADYPASSPHVVAVGGTRLSQVGGSWQGESVWNDGGVNAEGEREGAGAGGGGCSEQFKAFSWQQGVSGWSAVGCGANRAVADISADADPYTGVAVYDSTPVTEAGEQVKGWNVLGGTSVASPIIASVFALAGGAHGVAYPAQTLYENAAAAATSLHDVTAGSNGECRQPFNGTTGESGCTLSQQEASCSRQLICVAHSGYDGPSGVGTPNGIAAFLAPSGNGESQSEKGPSSSSSAGGAPNSGTASPGAGTGSTPSTPLTAAPSSAPMVQLSGLALTLHAVVALNHSRAKASQVAFSFTVNLATHLRAVLTRRVRVHGHLRWQELRNDSISLAAAGGRNSRRLNGRNVLARGLYRLTLSPAHGAARSIVFQIG